MTAQEHASHDDDATFIPVSRPPSPMNQWPDTETALVQRLSDPEDDQAWIRFDGLYRPVVYRFARTNGLQHADAEILVAEVMARVFRAARRWSDRPDPASGGTFEAGGAERDAPQAGTSKPRRFRAWLRTVARNAMLNLVTRQLAARGTGGTSHLISVSGRPMPNDQSRQQWEQEHQRQVFMTAAGEIRSQVPPDHWNLFWLTHVDGISIEQASQESGKSIGNIYAIRSRMLKRLRDCVERLEKLDEPLSGERCDV